MHYAWILQVHLRTLQWHLRIKTNHRTVVNCSYWACYWDYTNIDSSVWVFCWEVQGLNLEVVLILRELANCRWSHCILHVVLYIFLYGSRTSSKAGIYPWCIPMHSSNCTLISLGNVTLSVVSYELHCMIPVRFYVYCAEVKKIFPWHVPKIHKWFTLLKEQSCFKLSVSCF